MHRKPSDETKEALTEALQGLEGVRMTPPDDPKLTALKDDIRRTIEPPKVEKRKSRESNRRAR